jgi:predicted esterase
MSEKQQAKTALVVLLHGLGSSGEDMQDLADALGQELKHVQFLCPDGTVRPYTAYGGERMRS